VNTPDIKADVEGIDGRGSAAEVDECPESIQWGVKFSGASKGVVARKSSVGVPGNAVESIDGI
jgi:hypothetical protein